jgi:Protein of unknown function (DUF3551)
MRYLLAAAVAVFVGVMAVDLRPAQAYGNEPWCSAVTFDHSVVKRCQFRTFEECLTEITGGNRGFCEQNPDWYGRNHKVEAPKRHHKRRVKGD